MQSENFLAAPFFVDLWYFNFRRIYFDTTNILYDESHFEMPSKNQLLRHSGSVIVSWDTLDNFSVSHESCATRNKFRIVAEHSHASTITKSVLEHRFFVSDNLYFPEKGFWSHLNFRASNRALVVEDAGGRRCPGCDSISLSISVHIRGINIMLKWKCSAIMLHY